MVAAVTLCAQAMRDPVARVAGPQPVVWKLDSLTRIGGQPVSVIGSPRVVATPGGPAIEFNGTSDGLLLDANPIAGLDRFTIEVVFEPAADGSEEQRFLHIEEPDTGNRALVELRLMPDRTWCLDTFLRHGDASLTLIDRDKRQASASWHAAALRFDGRTMSHFVDRERQLTGEVAFRPLGPGRTSIGVRQNRVSWFKGRISTIRISAEALDSGRMLAAPAR